MTEYQVWADAFPDKPSFSARITAVKAEDPVPNWFHAVGQVTCVRRSRDRDDMAWMVEDLFRVTLDLPREDRVTVHLSWLDKPPLDLLD
jgi:hypothetical protein